MDWTFGGLWPYEPCWFEYEDGRMQYVDEGPRDGRPVVMVHGNPTWSFLYRNFIPPLVEADHRAIAIDDLGFGRSEKPDRAELYTIERHCCRAEALHPDATTAELSRVDADPLPWEHIDPPEELSARGHGGDGRSDGSNDGPPSSPKRTQLTAKEPGSTEGALALGAPRGTRR